ncbi:hypothetical protein FQR65_LT01036 [Abscondita terminalis]|nr:hypothetical protein FQR65_LT01036 [Abscondita terminalis]
MRSDLSAIFAPSGIRTVANLSVPRRPDRADSMGACSLIYIGIKICRSCRADCADPVCVLLKIWDGLRNKADANKDGQVSVDEWCLMWDDFSKAPDNPLEWQTQYLKFMFDLEDASGDGAIDADEFTSVCSCYGLEASECRNAFQKMSNGKANVSYEQFESLWKQYFVSENPSDPGNYIFGKTNF